MANVLALLSISQIDIDGVKASHDVFLRVPDTKTVAQLATFMTDYIGFYGQLVGAQGLDAQIKLHLPITGMPTAPVAGQENERTALTAFNLTGSRYVASIDIPCFLSTLITNGHVDLTSAGPYDSWLSFLESTPDGITIVSKYDDPITTPRTTAVTFRKHRRSLNRVSNEPA